MVRQLTVKLLTGERHSVDFSACRTVWDFKIQVGRITGVSPYQQKLARQNWSHLDLRDTAPLSEYGLQAGDTLLLIVKNEESIPIFLRNASTRTNTYHVLPSDGVSQFRARVAQQEKVPVGQFWLSYGEQTLEDGRKLSDYNIAPHGTVSLNLRLRGGVLSLGGQPTLEAPPPPGGASQLLALVLCSPLISATAKQPPLLRAQPL